jgi:hypothetical protein
MPFSENAPSGAWSMLQLGAISLSVKNCLLLHETPLGKGLFYTRIFRWDRPFKAW